MSLRIIEGVSKQNYIGLTGQDNLFPYEQIIKSGEEGPQLMPFFASLYNGPPYNRTTRNQNVIGTLADPIRFFLPVPTTQVWSMARIIFIIRDNGAFDVGGWGNQVVVSELTNGIRVGATINGVDYDFTPIPWTSHADLAAVAYDVAYHDWGQGDSFLSMRLTVTKTGTRLRLDGSKGDTFWMEVRDDLSYLTEQRCMAQGLIEGVYLG